MDLKKYDYIIVFLTTFFIYNTTTRLMSGGDEKPMALLPILILKYHTVFFDNLDMSNVLMINTGAHIVSQYPLVTPVLLLPFYTIFLLFTPSPDISMIAALGKYSAIILTTFAVLFFLLTMKRLIQYKFAVITTVAFAFGTLVWSVCSQILLGHTTSLLLLTLLLYVVVRNEEVHNRNNFVILGILSALFFWNRPSDAFMLLPVLYYLWLHKEDFKYFAIPCIIVSIPFLLYNLCIFGEVFGGYQPVLEYKNTWKTPAPGFIQNIAALLVSPSRGLFVFCPILLLALPGIWYLYKQRSFWLLSFIPALVLCIATYGLFKWWHGTGGYGPRYLTVLIPVLCLYAGFGIAHLWRDNKGWIVGLLGGSILINLVGAMGYPWSSWDIGTRDYWSIGGSEMIECFWAMVHNIGSNLKIFIFPPVDGGVVYLSDTGLNSMLWPVVFITVYTLISIFLILSVPIIEHEH